MLPLRSALAQRALISKLKRLSVWLDLGLLEGTPGRLTTSFNELRRPLRQAHTMPPSTGIKTPNNRPTHFVCFPLVTNDSVTELSGSLAYFRSITTPVTEPRSAPSDQPPAAAATGPAAGTEAVASNADENLRVIPEAAHRPPGTFHLTLGVMDLSDPEDMERAVKLLEQIDYAELLRQVERDIEGEMDGNGKGTTTRGEERAGDEAQKHAVLGQTGEPILDWPLRSLTRTISPPPLSTTISTPTAAAAAAELRANSTTSDHPISSPTTPLTTTLLRIGTFPRSSSARVFYAQPSDPTSQLQRFGESVRRLFQDEGLITETRPLVLHATVANMKYVKPSGGGGGRERWNGKGRRHGTGTVDARPILRFFNGGGTETSPSSSHDAAAAAADVGVRIHDHDDPNANLNEPRNTLPTSTLPNSSSTPITFAREIPITRIRICRMGAVKCDTPGWGMEYPAVAEARF